MRAERKFNCLGIVVSIIETSNYHYKATCSEEDLSSPKDTINDAIHASIENLKGNRKHLSFVFDITPKEFGADKQTFQTIATNYNTAVSYLKSQELWGEEWEDYNIRAVTP